MCTLCSEGREQIGKRRGSRWNIIKETRSPKGLGEPIEKDFKNLVTRKRMVWGDGGEGLCEREEVTRADKRIKKRT